MYFTLHHIFTQNIPHQITTFLKNQQPLAPKAFFTFSRLKRSSTKLVLQGTFFV
ncbi:unnamed protein product [Prunus brigantina]